MEQNKYFRFYVSREPDCKNLPIEKAGTLYVGNILNERVYWYDNECREWNRSLYPHSEIAKDPDFIPVKYFDNGYITSDDAMYYLTSRQKVTIPTSEEDTPIM